MSTLNLKKYEDKPIDVKPLEPNKETDASDPAGNITIMGSLSSVFAEALNKVLANKEIIANEGIFTQISEDIYKSTINIGSGPVTVYTIDKNQINQDPIKVFDKLNIALGQKNNTERYLVIENLDFKINDRVGIILEHAISNSDMVFYSKKAFVDYFVNKTSTKE